MVVMSCSSNHTSPYPFTLDFLVVLMVPPFYFNVVDSSIVHTLVTIILLHNSSTMYWLSSSSMFLISNSCRPPTLKKPNFANAWSSLSLASLSVYCENWTDLFHFSFVLFGGFYVPSSCTFRCFICDRIHLLFVWTVGTNVSLLATFMTDGTFFQLSLFQ